MFLVWWFLCVRGWIPDFQLNSKFSNFLLSLDLYGQNLIVFFSFSFATNECSLLVKRWNPNPFLDSMFRCDICLLGRMKKVSLFGWLIALIWYCSWDLVHSCKPWCRSGVVQSWFWFCWVCHVWLRLQMGKTKRLKRRRWGDRRCAHKDGNACGGRSTAVTRQYQITFRCISLSNSLPKETLLLLMLLVSGTTNPSLPLLLSMSLLALVPLEESSWDRKKWLRFSAMSPAKRPVSLPTKL